MKRRAFILASASALVLLPIHRAAASTAVEKPNYAGKWRLKVSQQSTAAGKMTFAIRPRSQGELVFTVDIAKGRDSSGIARDIRTSLRGKIDRSAYSIKLEGGDTLLFTAEMGTPRFELALIDSSVPGIEVEIVSE